MASKGKPVRGAVSGLLFGLFLGMELAFLKVMPLDFITLIVFPVGFLVLGIVLGVTAPFGRKKAATPS